MTEDTGTGRTTTRYYPAGSGVALARAPLGYVVVGMDIDEASVMLRVLVQSPDDPYMVAARVVTIPLAQGADGDLVVGTPTISKIDPEAIDDEVV